MRSALQLLKLSVFETHPYDNIPKHTGRFAPASLFARDGKSLRELGAMGASLGQTRLRVGFLLRVWDRLDYVGRGVPQIDFLLLKPNAKADTKTIVEPGSGTAVGVMDVNA